MIDESSSTTYTIKKEFGDNELTLHPHIENSIAMSPIEPGEIRFNPNCINSFGIKSALAYLKQATEKVDEGKRNMILEQLDDIRGFLLN